jgi:phage terminase small subunit
MENDGVKLEIDRFRKQVADGLMLDATSILQKNIYIAFADITDFVEFGKREVPVMTMFGLLEVDEGSPILDLNNEKWQYFTRK